MKQNNRSTLQGATIKSAGPPSCSTSLVMCSCCTMPYVIFNHWPGAVFVYAVECPYCGKATTWSKTAKSAVETWNHRRR